MKAGKKPTTTSLTMAALLGADDFMTAKQIAAATGEKAHAVLTGLWSLRQYKAVDSVEQEGALWWFATPDSDQRQRHHDERKEEVNGRRHKVKHRTVV